jgi:hypothetical protein
VEDLLCYKSLENHTTCEGIFNVIGTYMNEHASWQKCIKMRTGGDTAMLCKMAGVAACIKALVTSCSSSHSKVHLQALVKAVQADLRNMLDDTVKLQ